MLASNSQHALQTFALYADCYTFSQIKCVAGRCSGSDTVLQLSLGAWFVQIRILDFMAISMGIVAGVRPEAPLLQPIRPPRRLCTVKNYVLVSVTMLIADCVCQKCLMSSFLIPRSHTQPNSIKSYMTTSPFASAALFQQIRRKVSVLCAAVISEVACC